jgi:hypothetical protein
MSRTRPAPLLLLLALAVVLATAPPVGLSAAKDLLPCPQSPESAAISPATNGPRPNDLPTPTRSFAPLRSAQDDSGLALTSFLIAQSSVLRPQSSLDDAVGRIDAPMKAQLRHIWEIGQLLGRRPAVLARVGDSITASGSFLSDIGDGRAELGPHTELAAIIRYYRAVTVDREGGRAHNSLNRTSRAARAGWTGADILGLRGTDGGSPAPLGQEYSAINPAVALIMFGTNDLDQTGTDYFSANLEAVITTTLGDGIIPILSTIPDRMDSPQALARTPPFNAIIRALAARYSLPLIDYWTAMNTLPNHGLEGDHVHPSVYPGHGSYTFTSTGLRYGYPVRNYLTLRMLTKVRAMIINDGPPDR